MNIDSYSSGLVPEGMVSGIFKKSEHEEIMDELREIKKRLDTPTPPYVPYIPYVPPCPCRNCWGKCWGCPWGQSYPYVYVYPWTPVSYYYGTVPQWTDTAGGTA